jgi:predicted secreted hydrolase
MSHFSIFGAGVKARSARFAALMAVLLLATACSAQARSPVVGASAVEAMSAPNDEAWARATEPRELLFPADHGPHNEYRTEWWYYTGNLMDADGGEYGYQLTFFRSGLDPEAPPRESELASNQVYMAHLAVSDGPAQQHAASDRYSRGAAGLAGAQGEPAFAVWLEDWSAREIEPGVMLLRASAETDEGPIAVDLKLRETRPPVLHGDGGLHQKGPELGNASFYYSLIGLETSGAIVTPSGSVDVTGVSWMDHEFGTSALAEGVLGWDWFSLQLDDGGALMLYTFRATEETGEIDLKGTWVAPDGSQTQLGREDFTITVTDEWTSPDTAITYPVGWNVDIPGLQIELEVTPLLPDQEMDVQFVYWEGAVRAEGTREGAPLSGRGYVELTGYGSDPGEFQR